MGGWVGELSRWIGLDEWVGGGGRESGSGAK